MIVWRRLADIVAEHGAAALVSVHRVRGSAPREEGARMILRPDGAFHGSVGGGRLEWEALAAARDALAAGRRPAQFVDQALGPDLGQCCGGHVTLLVETFDAQDGDELARLAAIEASGAFEVAARLDESGRVRRDDPSSPLRGGGDRWTECHDEGPTPLLLFGAGHVGRALVLALAPLPFAVRWIDSRADAFPAHIPANVTPVSVKEPPATIASAPPGAFVLVTTHDHALDLAITADALARPDLPFVGLIGSETKRARFAKRFRELGIPERRIGQLTCPIGLPSIGGKEPAVIAASAAAQLLQARTSLERATEVREQRLEISR